MDLHPRVLPALEIKLGPQTFTCSGEGLVNKGHAFCSDIEGFLPLLEPKRTKAGKIAVRQPQIASKPKDWWSAQCAFRGLKPSGKIADLQGRLRSSDGSMDKELQGVQERLNLEYLEKNAAAREEEWLALEREEQRKNARDEMDATRLLREHFPDGAEGAPLDKVIVVKTNTLAIMRYVAERLGLEHQSTDTVLTLDSRDPSPCRWILVVGKSRSAVFAKISEIRRDALRSQQRAEEAEQEKAREPHRKVVSRLTESEKSGMWNVVGSWSIQCACIEDNWGGGNEKLTLDIYLSTTGRGRQIFALFDFIGVKGIMRFINPSSSQAWARKSTKPMRHERGEERNRYDEEEEEEDDEDDKEEDSSCDQFYMDNKISPSSSNPTWNYRWRGEETGEGEIQLGSDETIDSMTFKGDGGTKVEGKFKSGICCDECHFTGMKVSSTPSSRMPDLSLEWSSRGEKAWNYACVARWH
jgi:hypothetical protein